MSEAGLLVRDALAGSAVVAALGTGGTLARSTGVAFEKLVRAKHAVAGSTVGTLHVDVAFVIGEVVERGRPALPVSAGSDLSGRVGYSPVGELGAWVVHGGIVDITIEVEVALGGAGSRVVMRARAQRAVRSLSVSVAAARVVVSGGSVYTACVGARCSNLIDERHGHESNRGELLGSTNTVGVPSC
jgi:hypothetical protein